jgi:hypothetical protein
MKYGEEPEVPEVQDKCGVIDAMMYPKVLKV